MLLCVTPVIYQTWRLYNWRFKKKKKKNANADSKWVSWWERERKWGMMMEGEEIGWICSSRHRTGAGSLSCPAVCLADCYGACHCSQWGVQPLHGIQQESWINHWNTHTHAQSSLPFAWQSQDCPLVTPMLCTATVLALVCSFNWFLQKGEQGNNEKQTIKKCENQLKWKPNNRPSLSI